ncbi:MAG: RNA polymerase subunit sigma-70, partial [Acidobacteria bacterium]
MADQTQPEITRLLLAWEGGDGEAFDKLIPLVYPELRRL